MIGYASLTRISAYRCPVMVLAVPIAYCRTFFFFVSVNLKRYHFLRRNSLFFVLSVESIMKLHRKPRLRVQTAAVGGTCWYSKYVDLNLHIIRAHYNTDGVVDSIVEETRAVPNKHGI